MDIATFESELGLAGRALSITRLAEAEGDRLVESGCNIAPFARILAGEAAIFTADVLTCVGAPSGFGYNDEAVYDAESKSVGTMLKYSPDVAYASQLNRPLGVMEGFRAIEVKPLEEGDEPDTVCFFANPDQLAGLIMLYTYRMSEYDRVIGPFSSCCAAIFRLPFGEMRSEKPRAVIGLIDSARLNFEADALSLTVPASGFRQMLEDADGFFAKRFLWDRLKARIKETVAQSE